MAGCANRVRGHSKGIQAKRDGSPSVPPFIFLLLFSPFSCLCQNSLRLCVCSSGHPVPNPLRCLRLFSSSRLPLPLLHIEKSALPLPMYPSLYVTHLIFTSRQAVPPPPMPPPAAPPSSSSAAWAAWASGAAAAAAAVARTRPPRSHPPRRPAAAAAATSAPWPRGAGP